MDWLWPDLLLLLGSLPLIVASYIWMLRWRRRFIVRYSSLSLVQAALPDRSWLRRHLPFVLFVVALASLLIALGRPVAPVAILSDQTTIILTLDISRSMCLRDISPTRLQAAKLAALSFVGEQAESAQIGVVAFAGFAELAQAPTTDLRLLEKAITNLNTQPKTAIGSAILTSLDAIAEIDERVAPTSAQEESNLPRVPEEGYVPHVIVLLTDGASNAGPPPLSAAQQAMERGVRIYPISYGTKNSPLIHCGNSLGDDLSGGPGSESQSEGGGSGAGPDEATLQQIAEMTGGKFYSATSAAELQMVFENLGDYIVMTNQMMEVSVVFAAVAALMTLAALVLSSLWHPLL